MSSVTDEKMKVWVDGMEACRILDLPRLSNVERLVAEGLIGVRRLPGTRAIYRREDVVNLARISFVPARLAAPKSANE